ncbi:MAG: sulfate ABC transporter permease subunit [Betaproteobacteria bacterium]
MADAVRRSQRASEPLFLQRALVALTLLFLGLFLVVPLGFIFASALAQGRQVLVASLTHPDAWRAISLSLQATAFSVISATVFGLAAAWFLGRTRFPGRDLWIAILDLPFAISPVVAGLMFILIFGASGLFGPWLDRHDLMLVFAKPGILMVTAFVTFPFVARELLPLVETLSPETEEAAHLLGASSFQTLWRVTLPSIKWGLFHGVVLCASRAMGEFGAVSVVSGHIRGLTMTLPLHIEAVYNEYQFSAAFACASLLSLLALVSLALKAFIGWRARQAREEA